MFYIITYICKSKRFNSVNYSIVVILYLIELKNNVIYGKSIIYNILLKLK